MTLNSLRAGIVTKRSFANKIEPRRDRSLLGLSLLLGLLAFGACQASERPAPGPRPVAAAAAADTGSVKAEDSRMWMTVGERRFAITLAGSPAARAFAALLPLTLDMDELNGNEKKVELAKALPTNASRPGTIRNGDIMLYGANTLVVFYLSFESAYAYTRLGRVDDPAGLAEALGRRSVRVVFAKDQ